MMDLTLNVWRQRDANDAGHFETLEAKGISEHASFLEMLDIVNERLEAQGKEPIAFDHDCREGICGSCSMMINGKPHGGQKGTTACQLHMRKFKSGDHITIEPWRAQPFPVIKDLVVDRGAFDRIIQAGGYISANTGSACDANAILVAKKDADTAFETAACIGCGACVASCKNASAMLFVSAKLKHLNTLPQGKPETDKRSLAMLSQMDEEGFGACTNTGDCEAACPKEIKMTHISSANRNFLKALFTQE